MAGKTRPYSIKNYTQPKLADIILYRFPMNAKHLGLRGFTETVCFYHRLYHVLKIAHNRQPGHGTIKVICLSDISLMRPYATTE